jgi:hypothetical protein
VFDVALEDVLPGVHAGACVKRATMARAKAFGITWSRSGLTSRVCSRCSVKS